MMTMMMMMIKHESEARTVVVKVIGWPLLSSILSRSICLSASVYLSMCVCPQNLNYVTCSGNGSPDFDEIWHA